MPPRKPPKPRSEWISWPPIVAAARPIVEGYNQQGTMVTLRQVLYRLGQAGLLPINQGSYKELSKQLVKARRFHDFPDLADLGRIIHEPNGWDSPEDFFSDAAEQYARRRTKGQPVQLYVGVEKDTLRLQTTSWLAPLGIPVLVMRGFGSETYAIEVSRRIHRDGRPAILLYAGDLDPSGESIERDWVKKSGPWDTTIRLAVNIEDKSTYDLPWIASVKADGEPKQDARWPAFATKYSLDPSRPVQCEVEALDPIDLRNIIMDGVEEWIDRDAYDAVLTTEKEQKALIKEFFGTYPTWLANRDG
jgi:hypothetical protein